MGHGYAWITEMTESETMERGDYCTTLLPYTGTTVKIYNVSYKALSIRPHPEMITPLSSHCG